MHVSIGRSAALAVCLVLVASGCGRKQEAAPPPEAPKAEVKAAPAAPTDREVKVTEIRPNTPSLKSGETVRLALYGTYRLPEQGGNLGVVVQDAKSTMITSKLIPVKGGGGNFEQEVEFKVPATEKVTVNVPLYLKDETTSATVATHEFKVVPK
jgi:hypothetical protein